jgi:hypothetical protein
MSADDEVPEGSRDREQDASYGDTSYGDAGYDEVVRRLMVRQRELRGGTRVPGAPAEPPIDPGPSGRTPSTGASSLHEREDVGTGLGFPAPRSRVVDASPDDDLWDPQPRAFGRDAAAAPAAEAGGSDVRRGSEDAPWARLDVREPEAPVLDLTDADERPEVDPWADLAAEIDRLEIRIDETAAGLAELRFALHDLRDELERRRR